MVGIINLLPRLPHHHHQKTQTNKLIESLIKSIINY